MSSTAVTIYLDPAQLKAVLDRLDKLPVLSYERVVKGAVTFAFTPMVKAAKLNAGRHVDKGALRDSITVKRVNYKRQQRVLQMVGIASKFRGENGAWPVKYAHLVEYGARPHAIRLKRPLVLGKTVLPAGFVIHHPGARAKPFMRPAFDSEKSNVVARFRDKVVRGIDKEVRRLARRGISIPGLGATA